MTRKTRKPDSDNLPLFCFTRTQRKVHNLTHFTQAKRQNIHSFAREKNSPAKPGKVTRATFRAIPDRKERRWRSQFVASLPMRRTKVWKPKRHKKELDMLFCAPRAEETRNRSTWKLDYSKSARLPKSSWKTFLFSHNNQQEGLSSSPQDIEIDRWRKTNARGLVFEVVCVNKSRPTQ